MQFRVCILLLAGMTTGCMPWPHFFYVAPAVEGVVTYNGEAVQNAEISVLTGNPDETQKSVTDSNGRFITKPIKKLALFVSFPSDPLIRYSVTISADERHYQGLDVFLIGYGPKKISVACELSKPSQFHNDKQYCVRRSYE